jgi:hypothetical protein
VRHRLAILANLAVAAGAASWGCGLTVVGDLVPTSDAGAEPEASADGIADASAPRDGDPGSAGNAASALSFVRGSRQYVNVAHIPIPADFTIEAWVRPSSFETEQMIVAEDRSPLELDDQFRLALTATGLPYFVMTDSASSAHGLATDTQAGPFILSSSVQLVIGRWTHLAVTKEGPQFALLVDGAQVVSAAVTNGSFTRTDAFDFRIGARMGSGGPANYFDGLIDEVRLFRAARTAAEIASDMRAELPIGSAVRGNLVAYWRFDEGSGTVAHDDTRTYDGTLVNTPAWVASTAF